MPSARPRFTVVMAVACGALLAPHLLDAQEWGAVTLEVARPSFEGDGVSALAIRPQVEFRVGRGLSLVSAVALAHVSIDGFSSETETGNLYLGLRTDRESSRWEVGAFLPVADATGGFGLAIWALTDWDRAESYLPDVLAPRLRWSSLRRRESGLVTGGYFGGTAWIPTGDFDDESELLADYGATIGLAQPRFELSFAATGRIMLTTDGNLGERSVHQATITATFPSGPMRSWVALRLPLDSDLGDIFNVVLAAGFRMSLR